MTWLGPLSVLVFGLLVGLVAHAFEVTRFDRWTLLLTVGTFAGAYPLMYFAQEFIPLEAAVAASASVALVIIGVRAATLMGVRLGLAGVIVPAAAIMTVTLLVATVPRLQGILLTVEALGVFIVAMMLFPKLPIMRGTRPKSAKPPRHLRHCPRVPDSEQVCYSTVLAAMQEGPRRNHACPFALRPRTLCGNSFSCTRLPAASNGSAMRLADELPGAGCPSLRPRAAPDTHISATSSVFGITQNFTLSHSGCQHVSTHCSITSRSVSNAERQLAPPQRPGREVVHAERHRVDRLRARGSW